MVLLVPLSKWHCLFTLSSLFNRRGITPLLFF
nr:MAG TPA: hypothetical protein [Caudoviricetes sp.]